MTEHCSTCGSQLCGHGNCPECAPCQHCYGGDRQNKIFEYEDEFYGDSYHDYDDKEGW